MSDKQEKPNTLRIENVRLLDRYNMKNHLLGILYLSPTNLIFIAPENKKETWIMFSHIASVDKLPLTTTGSPLQIRCKTFLSVTFIVQKERDCHEVFTKLLQVSQPARIEDLYCFHYNTEDIPKSAGWTFFDLQAEFQRMRVPNDQWNLTNLNKDYALCDTYPRVLYVPVSATQNILWGSSKFRSKGRLPVLTYMHGNKAVICRCSQPLSGFKARCFEDEQMLDCVLQTNPNQGYMYVVDTRPRINAMANRAAGKGYESETFYDNIKFHFLGIENIHVMRSSLAKLIETCELKQPTMSNFLSGIESSGWLRHIQSVLETSVFIAQAVHSGISVVVHCSDGWDRTAQVCSLASLLLDNYYRTIQGYQALIEKDWLAFGHKFTDRCGFIAGDPKELSPVFTQFVDCTWQLLVQYPSAFQFNEAFLLTLHDHLTSCQYGTFIGNCEKERLDLRLNERTYSLWGYMANRMNEYMNPLYSDSPSAMLRPNLASQNIRFWRGMYCRFENGIHPRESINDLVLTTSDHSSSLEDHIKLLQKRITSVKQKLSAYGGRVKSEILDRTTKESQPTVDNKFVYKVEGMSKIVNFEDPLSASGLGGKADTDGVCQEENSTKDQSVDVLSEDLDAVALDWKTLRNVKECPCSTQFDHFSSKIDMQYASSVSVLLLALLAAHTKGDEPKAQPPSHSIEDSDQARSALPSFDDDEEEKRAWRELSSSWGKRLYIPTAAADNYEHRKRGWQDLQSSWGKRGWQDLQPSWGKRGWQDLQPTWGKRGWQDLQSSWGKRGWQDLQPTWGKRGWQDLHSSGWGKRGWQDMSSQGWGKRTGSSPDIIVDERGWDDLVGPWGKKREAHYFEDLDDEEPVQDKRAWANLRGTWGKRSIDLNSYKARGKRDPNWQSLKGLWGKRSDETLTGMKELPEELNRDE